MDIFLTFFINYKHILPKQISVLFKIYILPILIFNTSVLILIIIVFLKIFIMKKLIEKQNNNKKQRINQQFRRNHGVSTSILINDISN